MATPPSSTDALPEMNSSPLATLPNTLLRSLPPAPAATPPHPNVGAVRPQRPLLSVDGCGGKQGDHEEPHHGAYSARCTLTRSCAPQVRKSVSSGLPTFRTRACAFFPGAVMNGRPMTSHSPVSS